jgi:hypothetical protein
MYPQYIHTWVLETPFGLSIRFVNNFTSRNYNHLQHCYLFPQLTLATRQSLHSIRSSFHVFSLTESQTSNKAFNSHNKSSHDQLPGAVT